jgi:hypothetical protein
VEFTASSSIAITALGIFAQKQTQSLGIGAYTQWEVDIGIGSGGAETVILPDVEFIANTSMDAVKPNVQRLPYTIAAGTRIAVRCKCNRNTATERLLYIGLLGMQEPASSGGGGGSFTFFG